MTLSIIIAREIHDLIGSETP